MYELFEFFKALALITGCVILILILFAIVTAPIMAKKQRKLKKM